MEFALEPGLSYEVTERVRSEHTAASFGSGGVKVLATPMLVALLEGAAMNAVQTSLPAGWTTVGTKVEISHLAATPVGMQISGQAELVEVEGRRLVFAVEAHDEQEKVGQGRHERFIVNRDRFEQRARTKADSI